MIPEGPLVIQRAPKPPAMDAQGHDVPRLSVRRDLVVCWAEGEFK